MSDDPFSGDPRAVWLTEAGDDRRMRLLEAFSFVDPAAKRWDAPLDSVIDGASIPRPLWTLVGSPYTGNYRRASVVHDVACDQAGSDKQKRREADRMFYHACRAGGCSIAESIILYLGVRIGAIWPSVPQWAPALQVAATGPRLSRTSAEERMEADFRQAGEMVLGEGEVDDAEEIERRVDRALSTVTFMAVDTL
jgi:hypothetical protein